MLNRILVSLSIMSLLSCGQVTKEDVRFEEIQTQSLLRDLKLNDICGFSSSNINSFAIKQSCTVDDQVEEETLPNLYMIFDTLIEKVTQNVIDDSELNYFLQGCAEIPIAAAGVDYRGYPTLFYNQEYLSSHLLTDDISKKLSIIFIFGHEICHLMFRHYENRQNKCKQIEPVKRDELQADYFAGCLVAAFDKSNDIENSCLALNLLSDSDFSTCYPLLKKRKEHAKKGYSDYRNGKLDDAIFSDLKLFKKFAEINGHRLILRVFEKYQDIDNRAQFHESVNKIIYHNLDEEQDRLNSIDAENIILQNMNSPMLEQKLKYELYQ